MLSDEKKIAAFLDAIARDCNAIQDSVASKSAFADWLGEQNCHGKELLETLDSIANGTLLRYPEPDQRFAVTEFVVEASGAEMRMLWERHAPESLLRTRYGLSDDFVVSWEQDSSGLTITVGAIWSRPVNISCFWARLNGHLVLFYECVSAVYDYHLVEKWLLVHCNPTWDGGRRAHANAMNFHHCLEYCRC